jgi:hypothetical protein
MNARLTDTEASDSVGVRNIERSAREQLYVPILTWFGVLCLQLQEDRNVFSDERWRSPKP